MNKSDSSLSRPEQLLIVVAVTLVTFLLIDGINNWPICNRVFYPVIKNREDVQMWSAVVYSLTLVGGLPVAFMVWHWRDKNAQDTIDNQRKDVLLKEFQEIQMRAAGALDEKIPEEARRTLQIAAIHQLRPFLRGEFGKSFRRPAWEILRARLNAIAEEESAMDELDIIAASSHAERIIVSEDMNYIFSPDLPLEGTKFDFCDLRYGILSALILTRCSFRDSNLKFTQLEGANMENTFFISANLSDANLLDADMSRANLNSATLLRTKINDKTILNAAIYNDNTKFSGEWSKLSDEEKAKSRKRWIKRGMIHVRELEEK